MPLLCECGTRVRQGVAGQWSAIDRDLGLKDETFAAPRTVVHAAATSLALKSDGYTTARSIRKDEQDPRDDDANSAEVR
jgi:hypothetical protein